jgi:hypothetical protein
MKTDFTIFYSWQSDVGKYANKSYIENKIKKAISAIHGNNANYNIAYQESTSNDSGSPEIIEKIICKITNCDIFVCDVTPIMVTENEYEKKKCIPNPNVMYELGYAVGSIGWDRIILVWNCEFGDSQYAPFDIRNHKHIEYKKNPDSMKEGVSLDLEKAIKDIISEYDNILAKGIPSQEMRYDVLQFKITQKIMPENELTDSLRYFYDQIHYTTYMFNKWDDLYCDYTTRPNHHYLNSELDTAYQEFLSNLKRTTLIAAKEFIPINNTWEDINPELTNEQRNEIYRHQYHKLKEYFKVIRDSSEAYETQEKTLKEIHDSYKPLYDSYHRYRKLVQKILYI